MNATIGIPRSLLFHKYETLWSAFFEGLGCRIVTSPPTNRRILERGLTLAVDESCLPLKIFLGHVDALRDKVDHVLVPRIAALAPHEIACVKMWAAYDIVRNTLPELDVLVYNVDLRDGITEEEQFLRLGRRFCRDRRKVAEAYARARAMAVTEHEEEVRAQEEALAGEWDRPRILLVGHAYNLGDELIGLPLTRFLESQDVQVVLSERVDKELARSLAHRISPGVRWTYNKELLGAVEMYKDSVDGVIFLVTFPCGPDSLTAEVCHRKLDLPLATIVLDELQGMGGLQTRLESFVDIIKMKRSA